MSAPAMYLAPVIEPRVMRTVDLHHLAETVALSAPLVQPALVLTAQCPIPASVIHLRSASLLNAC